MAQYKCATCNEELRDGELVAISSKGIPYHWIATKNTTGKTSIDCAKPASMNNKLETFSPNIYFKGKVYPFGDIDKLPNWRSLKIDLNKEKNGEIILGNLEGLVK